MTRTLSTAFLALLFPLPALAGGPAQVADNPPPAVASAAPRVVDFSGLYGGISLGTASGDLSYILGGAVDQQYDSSGTLAGVHVGYNVQNGALVYGGELAFSRGDVEILPDFSFTRFIDVKGRIGYVAGNALIYGTLGWSSTRWTETGFPTLSGDGPAYGLGVDLKVSERVMVGAEYLWREIKTEPFPDPFGDYRIESGFGTLSLRVSMTF